MIGGILALILCIGIIKITYIVSTRRLSINMTEQKIRTTKRKSAEYKKKLSEGSRILAKEMEKLR